MAIRAHGDHTSQVVGRQSLGADLGYMSGRSPLAYGMGPPMTKAASGEILGRKPRMSKAASAGDSQSAESKTAKAPRKARTKKKNSTAAQERPRGGEARQLADFVPAVGATAFRKFGFIQSSIVSRWGEIVGAKLAKVTQPAMIRFPVGAKSGGTLHLSICGAHAPMLQHIAPDILASVNRFFGYAAIAHIRMAHGMLPPKPPKPKPEPKPVPKELSDSLREIADDELRTVLERMAAGLANAPNLPRIR